MAETQAGSVSGVITGDENSPVIPPNNIPETIDSNLSQRLGQLSQKVVVKETNFPDRKYYHFGKEVRLGSRKITIKLVDKFSILPKEEAAKHIREEVVKKIGSTWKRGTRNIIRGLTSEEEAKYLPNILGVRVASDQWNDRVLEHWANFTISVPNNKIGLELEVGFQEVRTTSGVEVEPISIEDYMRFNFCREHSNVATEIDQLDNYTTFTYYIVDKQKDIIEKEKEFGVRQNADKLFIQLTASQSQNDFQKIDWILETSGGPNKSGMNVTGLTKIQKNIALEDLKNSNLSKFIDIIQDKQLETKSLIRRAIDLGIVLQEGNSFFYKDKLLGSSLNTTVAWLESPANQKDKLMIQESIKGF